MTHCILLLYRIKIRFCTPFHRFVERTGCVIYPQGNHFDPIAMLFNMFADFRIGDQGGCKNKPDLILYQDIGCFFLVTGFKAGIGQRLEAEKADLEKFRSEFFGQLSQLLAGREGVRVVVDDQNQPSASVVRKSGSMAGPRRRASRASGARV